MDSKIISKITTFPIQIIRCLLFFLIGIGSLLPTPVAYPEPTPSAGSEVYKILPGASQVRFHGRSPFDKFTGTSTQVDGLIEGEITAITEAPSWVVKAEVRVDARTLDTGNNSRDKEMMKTLETEKYPTITFKLNQVSLIERSGDTGPSKYKVEGTLSVHGVERPIITEVESKVEANRMIISGNMPLDITDYKIKPPRVPILAFLRMDKNVTVDFVLVAEAGP